MPGLRRPGRYLQCSPGQTRPARTHVHMSRHAIGRRVAPVTVPGGRLQ